MRILCVDIGGGIFELRSKINGGEFQDYLVEDRKVSAL